MTCANSTTSELRTIIAAQPYPLLSPEADCAGLADHYRGFATTQWDFFLKNGELKPLLYAFRVLLAGIHLMRTGEAQADLRVLRTAVGEAPEYLGELMAAKAEVERGPAARFAAR